MSELKPCPACGKPVELEGGQSWHDQHCFLIKCYECGCSRVSDTDKDECVRRWNAMPRHLRWTQEPPTEPGYYWLRQASTKGLVQIVRACGEELPYSWEDAEWAGPIQEPVK